MDDLVSNRVRRDPREQFPSGAESFDAGKQLGNDDVYRRRDFNRIDGSVVGCTWQRCGVASVAVICRDTSDNWRRTGRLLFAWPICRADFGLAHAILELDLCGV